jgi:hypothetical protein
MATLSQINTAITVVLDAGQSYRIGDRTYTRADLGDLREMRKDLIGDDAAKSNKKPRISKARMHGTP